MTNRSLSRFYQELKQRKVIRVGVAYAVVAWVLVEIGSVMFPALLLPDWSVRLLIAFVIVGFPVAVVLAWAVELTPEGPRPDKGAQQDTQDTRTVPAAAGGEAGFRSIAVLPLLNMSNDPENEYFSDGMAEEVLNRLCKLPQLTVASRTSSFSFKGKDIDLRTVAERLGVDVILEGSVRRSGDRVRITAQLIDGHSDRHLWSETYERDLKDVFSVQDEIAQNIVRTLQLSLTPGQQRAIRTRYATEDMEAYDFYLRGRDYFYKGDIEYGLRMFEQAIRLDPRYAQAWSGAADGHSWICQWGVRTPEHLAKADERSRHALSLAPDLAEGHASRGFALVVNAKHDEAEAEFKKAIELDPQLFEGYYYAGRASFAQGKHRQAADMFRQASAIRPDDVAAASLYQTAIEACGTPEEIRDASEHCIRVTERHIALHPDDALALSRGAGALVADGQVDRGLEWAERAYAINRKICGYNVACAFAKAGKTDRALELLAEHASGSNMDRSWLEKDSDWQAIRDHPRFREILESLD